MNVLRWIVPLAALAGPGCLAVGPDATAPDVAAPADFAVELARGLEEGPADVRRWWTRFEDPVLDALVADAVDGNLGLKEAWARIDEALALSGVAAGERLPRVDFEGTYERSRQSVNAATPIFPGFPVVQDDHRLILGASWEVDLWGRVRRLVEAADAEVDAEVEALADLRRSLVAEVAQRYVELRGAERREAIARTNLELQGRSLDLVRARVDAGLGDELELAQARTNVERTRSAIPAFEAEARRAANALAVLLGLGPGELAARLGETGAIPVHAERIAVGLPADLLRRRPDLRRLEREVFAQTARIGAAEAEHYPRVELLGSIGRRSGGAGELFDSGSEVYAFGPRVSWPLFAGGAIEARVDAEEARLEQALLRYEAAALEAWREASDALDAYLREHDRRDALTTAVEHARAAVRKAEALYRAGLVDFQSVLDDQRTQFAVEDELATSEAAIAGSVVALYRALGGGLEAMD